MTEDCWEEGVGGWVYTLQQQQGSPTPQLSVLFEQGRIGLPNGMCWNMVSLCDHTRRLARHIIHGCH